MLPTASASRSQASNQDSHRRHIGKSNPSIKSQSSKTFQTSHRPSSYNSEDEDKREEREEREQEKEVFEIHTSKSTCSTSSSISQSKREACKKGLEEEELEEVDDRMMPIQMEKNLSKKVSKSKGGSIKELNSISSREKRKRNQTLEKENGGTLPNLVMTTLELSTHSSVPSPVKSVIMSPPSPPQARSILSSSLPSISSSTPSKLPPFFPVYPTTSSSNALPAQLLNLQASSLSSKTSSKSKKKSSSKLDGNPKRQRSNPSIKADLSFAHELNENGNVNGNGLKGNLTNDLDSDEEDTMKSSQVPPVPNSSSNESLKSVGNLNQLRLNIRKKVSMVRKPMILDTVSYLKFVKALSLKPFS